MTRLLSLLTVLLLLVASREAAAAITVTINDPTPSTWISSPSLPVYVSVTSSFALQSVHAQVGASGQDLTNANNVWGGTVTLGSPSYGTYTLTVTATDVNGASASSQVSFAYDLPPTIDVTSPAPWSVGRPGLTAGATCADDGPAGCMIEVRYVTGAALGYAPSLTEAVLASGPSPFSQALSLPNPSGGRLDFTAVDSRGSRQTKSVVVAVDTSPSLIAAENVDGKIVDADCTRLLVRRTNTLEIFDRATKQYTVVGSTALPGVTSVPETSSDPTFWLPFWTVRPTAALTPNGAVFIANTSGDFSRGLFQFRSGQTTRIGNPDNEQLAVGGNYVVWTNIPMVYDPADAASYSFHYLIRRDLVSDTEVSLQMAQSAVASVDRSGDVATRPFETNFNSDVVNLWHNGSMTSLTTYAPRVVGPLIDGPNVVWVEHSAYIMSTQTSSLMLYGPNGKEALVPTESSRNSGYDLHSFAVGGGYVAYDDMFGGWRQVFVRDPAGVKHRLTSFGSDSVVSAAAPDGSVLFLNGGRRYFAAIGVAPIDLGGVLSAELKPYIIGGQWFLAVGNTLFSIALGADAGATASTCGAVVPVQDAGTSDASLDGATAADATTGNDAASSPDASTVDATANDASNAGDANGSNGSDSGDPGDGSNGGDGGCNVTNGETSAPLYAFGVASIFVAAAARRRRRIKTN